MFVANAGVRNLLHAGDWHAAADRIRLLAVTNFLHHASAADRSHLGARHPAAAADGASRLAAAGAGGRAAGVAGRCTGWLSTDGSGNLLGLGDPVTRADFDLLGLGHWLAGRVADIAVTGFGFGLISRAADFAALGLIDRFADRAADIAVAGLIAGLANRAADIAIAGLIAGLADRAADIAIAGLEAGLANRAADIAIAGLIAGLADRVALVAIAGLIDVAIAGYGNLLAALFVNGAAAIDRLLFVDSFSHGLIAGSAAALGRQEVAARSTGVGGTASCAGRSAIEGFDSRVATESQQTRCDDNPSCMSHRSVLVLS